MEDTRRQAMQNARAVIEQARAAKEIEGASLEVNRLAVQVSSAVTEQTKALNELAKEGEEVRRIAKQSARAVGEQNQVVNMLSSSTVRYTTGLERVVRSVSEQAAGSQQLGQTVSEIRARARELSAAIKVQASGVHARDVSELRAGLHELRDVYLSHADALTELCDQLARGGNGAAPTTAGLAAGAAAPVEPV
jgi:methyl-accepting chemotaxis protein